MKMMDDDYQKEYGREYYEKFLGSQNTEKDANFEFFLDLILKQRKIGSVVDIGCGKGGFLKVCQRRGVKNLYGVDVSSYALKAAGNLKGVKLYQTNLERDHLPFKSGQFDCTVAIDIVEHVKNSRNIFSEAARVLKKGGIFFMTTENTGSVFSNLFSPFFEKHAGHINLQRASVWEKSLNDAGFSHIKSKGIILHGFPPLLDFRNFLRKFGIPVIAHPIIFPLKSLTGTLIISARTN